MRYCHYLNCMLINLTLKRYSASCRMKMFWRNVPKSICPGSGRRSNVIKPWRYMRRKNSISEQTLAGFRLCLTPHRAQSHTTRTLHTCACLALCSYFMHHIAESCSPYSVVSRANADIAHVRVKAKQEQVAYQASLRKEQMKVDSLERTLEQKVSSTSWCPRPVVSKRVKSLYYY